MDREEFLKRASSISFRVLLAFGVGAVSAQSIYSVSAVNYIFNRDNYGELFLVFGGLFYFATIYRGVIALAGDARKCIKVLTEKLELDQT